MVGLIIIIISYNDDISSVNSDSIAKHKRFQAALSIQKASGMHARHAVCQTRRDRHIATAPLHTTSTMICIRLCMPHVTPILSHGTRESLCWLNTERISAGRCFSAKFKICQDGILTFEFRAYERRRANVPDAYCKCSKCKCKCRCSARMRVCRWW